MVPASPLMTRASRRKQRLQVQENFEVPAWVHLIGGKFPEIIDRLLANLNLAQELVFACGIESHALHSLVQHDNIVQIEQADVGQFLCCDLLYPLIGCSTFIHVRLEPSCSNQLVDEQVGIEPAVCPIRRRSEE